jgi:hypothetical protein
LFLDSSGVTFVSKSGLATEDICMTDVAPLEIPAVTAGTTAAVVPVYRYLMQQLNHWLRQAFFIGRPKLPVSRVIESMQANNQILEEAAYDWALPMAAIEEALAYSRRFRDVTRRM